MKKQNEIFYASILHDIGKVFQRADNVRIKHGIYGKEQIELLQSNKQERLSDDVLFAIANHHAKELASDKNISDDHLAYIVYEADNIASASDRRDIVDEENNVFNPNVALSSVFNVVNLKENVNTYKHKLMTNEKYYGMNFPQLLNEASNGDYKKISNDIKDVLSLYNYENDRPNSLLYAFKNILNYVPSSTNISQITDISLYEHLKLTAALASAMYLYCEENNVINYREKYMDKLNRDCEEFLMASIELSGIQKFIYTVSSKGAAKMLKARSFYLEILVEHIVDEILDELDLTRANIIYNGGGHSYLLLPNTEKAKSVLEKAKENINKWLIDKFDNDLYIGFAYKECSANNFNEIECNSKGEKYEKVDEIFRNLSLQLAKSKGNRYSKEELSRLLLPNEIEEDERECKVCKKSEYIVYNEELDDDLCKTCDYIYELGTKLSTLADSETGNGYILITNNEYDTKIELPTVSDGQVSYLNIVRIQEEIPNYEYKRIYTINSQEFGNKLADNISVGMYGVKGNTYNEYAEVSEGVSRIGVLRADVDNLGSLFKNGLKNQVYGNKLNTLSRYSMLSSKLSDFFKTYINILLTNESMQNNKYCITNKKQKGNLKIIYSGGDDIFIIGAWDEVIEVALLLDTKLKEYTIGKVKLSAGIGIFDSKFPISKSSEIVMNLEEISKAYKEDGESVKNAITLFEEKEENRFSFEEFKNGVLEKIRFLEDTCEFSDENMLNGKVRVSSGLLHKLLTLFENSENQNGNKRNLVQLVYILGRLEEEISNNEENNTVRENFQELKKKLYDWKAEHKECRNEINQLVMAIKIIIYKNRRDV